MKSISDLVGQVKISQRLNNSLAFKNIELSASNYESLMSKLSMLDWQKTSSMDKKAVQKKIQTANESVTREMQAASNQLLSKLASQQDKLEQASKATHTDLAIAGMLAGKTANQLFEIGCQSASAARILTSTDAGVFGGLSREQVNTLRKHAAPAQFAEVEETEKAIDTLIRLKSTLDAAHGYNEIKFSANGNEQKIAGILNDEAVEEAAEESEQETE
ncbi:hypothetical protein [Shewanella aestuarii]|uniref:Uncharacterized protein n=1 Tax=Shewanella aestuarii TaxID=1028752 RepID=A0A6G9QHQ0_9GAMM|nr:hypothetical protein [Shewanella aestuarii]QIR13928.1 hypothetical protein HBH39_04965 [Shewanella aestuarii]